MRVLMFFVFFLALTLILDTYFYYGIKSIVNKSKYASTIKTIYWSVSGILIASYTLAIVLWFLKIPVTGSIKIILQAVSFILLVPKLLSISFFLIDDLIRFFRWGISMFQKPSLPSSQNTGISRLKFLQLTGLSFFGLFFGLFSYGILRGGFNYQVKKQKVKLPKLPKGMNGLKIVQISDLHLGSFLSTRPIKEAVRLINELEADFVFFTGDLVNDISEEAVDFIPELKKIKAKQGVYSVLGNHDYGDYYYNKDSPDYLEKKQHNLDLMQKVQKECGWNLMMDENVIFESNGEELAIIGIQNWAGTKSFARYGDLHKAYKGAENAQVKLLLSHDPSHWDVQVTKEFKEIDLMFSGHTHGMQFGIEIPGIKWSPAKYVYPHWAGMYQNKNQSLYVNRGLGFIGYPGRVGISPEITLFELTNG